MIREKKVFKTIGWQQSVVEIHSSEAAGSCLIPDEICGAFSTVGIYNLELNDIYAQLLANFLISVVPSSDIHGSYRIQVNPPVERATT